MADKPTEEPHQSLFLHVITPTFYLESGIKRPERIVTTLVYPEKPFAVTLGKGFPNVSGLIEFRKGKIHGELTAANGLTTTLFDGNLELERPVSMSEVAVGFSGVVLYNLFVLSTNSDCRPSLDGQASIDRDIANIK